MQPAILYNRRRHPKITALAQFVLQGIIPGFVMCHHAAFKRQLVTMPGAAWQYYFSNGYRHLIAFHFIVCYFANHYFLQAKAGKLCLSRHLMVVACKAIGCKGTP